MAKPITVDVSDSESERQVARSAKKQTVSVSRTSNDKEPTEDEDGEEEEENGEGSEPGSEEYEIEAILDAKLGTFPEGRIGYLVKWKGYGDDQNSWVDEQDAGNAAVLIEEYWRKNKKEKKGGRKSIGPGPKPSVTKGRKSSTARGESSEVEEPRPKKRGRLPKVKSPSEEQEDEDNNEDEAREKKKPRKSVTQKAKASPEPMDEDEGEEESFKSMKPWMSSATWEHVVDTIDTVERTLDGRLIVYFTLKGGKGRGREDTKICKDKMPKKVYV
ncbi:hypothetical protein AcV7_009595 [Taiwanofungus camphoratus]|nr:hypothetical protein AcW2_005631 [Antrodia cinnamomea]KAI0947054.1 hypothetical protein AcV7_009595 [Antrodia cinnamomea]